MHLAPAVSALTALRFCGGPGADEGVHNVLLTGIGFAFLWLGWLSHCAGAAAAGGAPVATVLLNAQVRQNSQLCGMTTDVVWCVVLCCVRGSHVVLCQIVRKGQSYVIYIYSPPATVKESPSVSPWQYLGFSEINGEKSENGPKSLRKRTENNNQFRSCFAVVLFGECAGLEQLRWCGALLQLSGGVLWSSEWPCSHHAGLWAPQLLWRADNWLPGWILCLVCTPQNSSSLYYLVILVDAPEKSALAPAAAEM